MNKIDMLKYTGTLQQLAYTRECTVHEGRANGLRAVEVKNEDMRYLVLGDKCLDVAELEYKGITISFTSKPGLNGRNQFDTHGEEAHDHLPQENATPLEELLVMMKYLVSHNDAHAQEVADLARELMAAGKDVAYDEIMDAVSDFDMVNAKLAAILDKLNAEEF